LKGKVRGENKEREVGRLRDERGWGKSAERGRELRGNVTGRVYVVRNRGKSSI
jgi:hypothetical protein